MKESFWNRDRISGLIIYPLGDTAAQVLLGEVSLYRIMVMAVAGALIYSWEIPLWFAFIQKRATHWFTKTMLAILYFNPLWIARHLFFIAVALNPKIVADLSLFRQTVSLCLDSGLKSFLGAIVLSVMGNFVIQNRMSPRHRFTASAVFSGLMAVYYALSKVWL